MCGINGIINFTKSIENKKDLIKLMNKSLEHRGPDGEGIFISNNNNVILGSKRLSIVSIDDGVQPLIINQKSMEYSIVFNGEIYNYLDLRKELEENKQIFKTKSDTEVILRAYIYWGNSFIKKLNGQFSIVIYNGKKKELFLARDRLGIKPLFYYQKKDNSLIFSSEPKGILEDKTIIREIDEESLVGYFLQIHTFANGSPNLNKSYFKNIFSLEPGTYAIFKKKNLNLIKYYELNIHNPKNYNKGEHIESLKNRLNKAILDRIPSEVKFGTLLSGGLDSSIITSIIAKTKTNLLSGTINFTNNENNFDYNYAKSLAKNLNINLVDTKLTPEIMLNYVSDMVKAMDSPHDTFRQLSLFHLYKIMKDSKCRVVMIGEGSDEFNLGYYNEYPGFKKDIKLIKNAKDLEFQFSRRIPIAEKYFTKKFIKKISFKKIIDSYIQNYYQPCSNLDPIIKMQYYYLKKFLNYRLDANDRSSMFYSIEARIPFCDHNFFEEALKVPKEMNLENNSEKIILKNAYEDILPKEIISRAKSVTPKSKDLDLYSLFIEALEKKIKFCKIEIWNILNKEEIILIIKYIKSIIKTLKKEGQDATDLTKELSISSEITYKIKHISSILSFIEWYEIYF